MLAIAASIHVYIVAMESLWWTTERARAVFATTEAEAAATKELAFNQGVYNLCLAVLIDVGLVVQRVWNADFGLGLMAAGAATMFVAGLTLLVSSPDKARSALIHLAPPAIGLALVAVARIV